MLDVLIVAGHFKSATLSYYWDWFETLRDRSGWRVDVLDTLGKKLLPLAVAQRRRKAYDLVLYPYGFFYANQDPWSRACLQYLNELRGTKVFFLENEYRLLNHKLAYALALGADYLTTQLPKDVADQAYAPFFDTRRIVALPHGLNLRVADELHREYANVARSIDLGFSGDPYPFYIGHQDRQDLARYFIENAARLGLEVAARHDREERMDRRAWHRYLHRCRGVLHHESGTDFIDTSDTLRCEVSAFTDAHPAVSYGAVHEKFFARRPPGLSGRALAPRHLEAIAARSCQVMFPGRFNDVLRADQHYLALRRDFSNVDELIRRFRDEGVRRDLTARAYDHVRAEHTLDHRIAGLLQAIGLS